VIADRHDRHWSKLARAGHHEPDAEAFCWAYLRTGDHVVDVGAHVGMLTAVMAQRVGRDGRVFAVEPDAANRRALQATVARHDFDQVSVHDDALSDREGAATLLRPDGAWGAFLAGADGQDTVVRSFFHSSRVTRSTIHTTTLDAFREAHPSDRLDLIKIDVDGPELAVLRGARATIAQRRPAILVEVSAFYADHGATAEDLFRLLTDAGYRLWGAPRGDRDVRPMTAPEQAALPDRDAAINLFCEPRGDRRWADLWFSGAGATSA
jgi:FkbM family methyltransferase